MVSAAVRQVLLGLVRGPYLATAALALAVWPLVALTYQLGLLVTAYGVSWVFGQDTAAQAITAGAGDEVYSRLIAGMLAGSQPVGLAVRTPVTDAASDVFASSSALPAGTWLGVVFAAGSSAVGAHLVQLLVVVAMTVAGALLLAASHHGANRPWLARVLGSRVLRVTAAVWLVYAVGAGLQLSWQAGSGGDMALSMVATKILGLDAGFYDKALAYGSALSISIDVLILSVAATLGLGLTLLLLRGRFRPILRGSDLRTSVAPVAMTIALFGLPVQLGAAFAGAGPLEVAPPTSSVVATAAADAPALPESPPPETAAEVVLPPDPVPGPMPPWPSVVTIAKTPNGFEYRVNDHVDLLRGVGYDAPNHAEPAAVRRVRFDRDFSLMAASGINTILGWDESEFDEVLMVSAAEHGVGVILPFDFRPNIQYERADVRQQMLAQVSQRVDRFKDSPALRMWGLGNEVLHGIADLRSQRAQGFGIFLAQAADLVHNLDPNHPVVYRDAEDVYFEPVAKALRADGQPRPWFVYGMNFFSLRIEDALAHGPIRTLDNPLIISEFGPVGLRPVDRPNGYAKLWSILRGHPESVIGGFAYVWNTNGPEPLDRNFGLTDDNGEPVDGSVSKLATLYKADQAAQRAAATQAAMIERGTVSLAEALK